MILNEQAILEEKANGVMYQGNFFPYFVITINPTVNGYQSPHSGARYYIKYCQLVVRVIAGDTTTVAVVQGVINRVTNYFGLMVLTPGVAQAKETVIQHIGALCDTGTPVQVGYDVQPTYMAANIMVAEVEDV
jgi:hypothetical protein